ncbi:hypothetical protein BLNAU_7536 [Blattamonas nauphoetae]|uniref:Uncharacterized protein n=1 Tax=Blattamonas nauphoetae TaxID=2049346 RepID=A0ABQ9Y1M4_9EUKA|nr:hypothetical protein BLNAU_7536 [Blattamonas nauphoetae]
MMTSRGIRSAATSEQSSITVLSISNAGVHITLAPMESGLSHRPASPIGSQTQPFRSSHVFPSTADNRREEHPSTVSWKGVECSSPQREGWCELSKKTRSSSPPDQLRPFTSTNRKKTPAVLIMCEDTSEIPVSGNSTDALPSKDEEGECGREFSTKLKWWRELVSHLSSDRVARSGSQGDGVILG